MPSGDRSGCALELGGLVRKGEAGVQVTLAFDVGAAAFATGNGAYLLNPVVRAEVVPL